MFEKAKKWLSKHRKGVIITASVLAITGTVAILLINGKKSEDACEGACREDCA